MFRLEIWEVRVRERNGEGLDNVRFPWIHNSEPVDFHTSKSLASEEPLCASLVPSAARDNVACGWIGR